MRRFKDYIVNEWKLNGNSNIGFDYKYFPKNKTELQDIIIERINDNPVIPYLLDIDTSKITDMSDLFACDGGSVLFNRFRYNIRISKLDLSTWNTSKCKNMVGMFRILRSLKELKQNFDTSNVTNMMEMFWNCDNIETLDLSNFNTDKVKNFKQMFSCCEKLKELDFSKINTKACKNFYSMFWDCYKLEKVKGLENFEIDKDALTDAMFRHCDKLRNNAPANLNYYFTL